MPRAVAGHSFRPTLAASLNASKEFHALLFCPAGGAGVPAGQKK
jgi:hypothetical protein